MFKKNLLPVWIAIILLSGMFLMGQEPWSPAECIDNDGDGYGNPAAASCTYPELDCDDTNADVSPGAEEICDGLDNQCPGDHCFEEVDAHCSIPIPGMAWIPCGCFDMGDRFEEGDPDERPVHNVCISAFQMDVHEVTNAKYAECVDDGGCTPPYYTFSRTRETYYGNPAYDEFPVIWVNWNQATDYCTWAGKRLPTEAEWEYAARGGLAGRRYTWGDTIDCDDACHYRCHPPLSCLCWYHCHNGICDNDTHPVGSYAPNGYWLYDMAGNVWEWVNDWYDSNYYSVSPPNDPPGPVSGNYRVVRDGGWYVESNFVRVAERSFGFPDVGWKEYRGFRCAR